MNQVNGTFEAKDETMNAYLHKVKEILRKYEEQRIPVCIVRIPRGENYQADLLSKMATSQIVFLPPEVRVEIINTPSITHFCDVFS